MNSDELGEKGESRFRELCADARLICNKADRDRAGWDFIVEFPLMAPSGQTFDSRAVPISCHMQVKTLLAGSSSVKMRLSSVERLAKEPKPSFVYVLKVDNSSLKVKDAYLIHLVDNRLGAILKRLRLEQAKGTAASQLNKKTLSLTPSNSERIEPTGAALRAALSSACSSGMSSYVQAKNDQLRKLGFDMPPIRGRMKLKLEPDDDIGDVFLGIRKEVPVTHFRTVTSRFGIELPEIEVSDGRITIEPHAMDQCSITIRDDTSIHPAVFGAQVFLSPIWLRSLAGKAARIESNLFSIVVGSDPYEVNYDIDAPKRETPDGWRQFWRAILAFSSGHGSIKIVAQNSPLNFNIDIPASQGFSDVGDSKYWMRVCEDLSYLLAAAGVYPEPQLEFRDIESGAKDIICAATFLREDSMVLSADCTAHAGFTIPATERCIVANILELGVVSVGYYRVADMVGTSLGDNKFTLKARTFSPGRVRLLSSRCNIYDDFVADIIKAENISMVIQIDANSALTGNSFIAALE